MNNLFLGMTLGGDPHTLGVFNAGKIAKKAGLAFRLIPPDSPDSEKLRIIHETNPAYIGLSYRLSPEKAISELRKFLKQMDDNGMIRPDSGPRVCFAGLLPTLREIHNLGLDSEYHLHIMGSYPNLDDTTRNTAAFFGLTGSALEEVVKEIRQENETERIDLLDQIADHVIENDAYLVEPPLPCPSNRALIYFPARIDESDIPVIRSHFGVPAETILPTVEGIRKIALHGAVDEISIGSSDLSQRYYGNPQKFLELKNDGGVPYKDIHDLRMLALAAQTGNYPSLKPYCHVTNIIGFIDDCLSVGMLKGGHQAIPLFWFNELDGRGNMTLEESIDAHLEAVDYLARLNIPVEMNDPNQWSSRLVHDTLFVVSYALISSVMYRAGVKNIVLQCQFNKPATTGDYADLGKFTAVMKIVEALRPRGNSARILYETRSGIEHFSTDLKKAKHQLPRSVLLQMLINPSITHLVSYCEADHVATADDVIESSKILRHAVHAYQQNAVDIKKKVKWDIVNARAEHLYNEALVVLNGLVSLAVGDKPIELCEMYRYLSRPDILKKAVQYRFMTAPGIANKKFANPSILTKTTEHGFLDCYERWEDKSPMPEQKRINALKKQYDLL